MDKRFLGGDHGPNRHSQRGGPGRLIGWFFGGIGFLEIDNEGIGIAGATPQKTGQDKERQTSLPGALK
jgi:hypothetical protein